MFIMGQMGFEVEVRSDFLAGILLKCRQLKKDNKNKKKQKNPHIYVL